MMHFRTKTAVLFLLLALFAALGTAITYAHFHTFWPQSGEGYGKRGVLVTWKYFWGHPYEMILFDAQKPVCYAVKPDGSREDLALREISMKDEDTGETRRAFEFSYKPMVMGDHYICMEPPPYFIEEEGSFIQDFVKQPLHVTVEKGWDRPAGMEIELVPLTRPYGLEEGFVFKARALFQGKPLVGAKVEIEKFCGFYVEGDRLPKDPFGNEDTPLITRSALTDCNGYVVFTLDEPGWWILSVSHGSGEKEHNGKMCPVEKRGGIWVHVKPRFVQK